LTTPKGITCISPKQCSFPSNRHLQIIYKNKVQKHVKLRNHTQWLTEQVTRLPLACQIWSGAEDFTERV